MAQSLRQDTSVGEAHFVLNSGHRMPALGLGTWKAGPDVVRDAVFYAIVHAGYRHVDAAAIYGNQEEVGAGLKAAFDAGIKREDVFVTSKLWITSNSPEKAKPALLATLKALQLDYLDLYLMHWPIHLADSAGLPPKKGEVLPLDTAGVWKVMEGFVKENLVRSIGISNFTVPKIDALLRSASIVPAVHQVELHPALRNEKLLEHAKKHNYLVTAYSSFGSAFPDRFVQLLQDPAVIEVAKKLGKSPGQILLRWALQQGVIVLPKSSQKARIKENSDVFGWSIPPDDMKKISSLPYQKRTNVAELLFVTSEDDEKKLVTEFWDGEV